MTERPQELPSVTYKVRVPGIDPAVYVTISDMGGHVREVFINSKHMPSFPWISHLTRTTSKRLRQGEELSTLVNEMAETHDTGGGYIIPKSGGVWAKSIVHHIGWLLSRRQEQLDEEHNQGGGHVHNESSSE